MSRSVDMRNLWLTFLAAVLGAICTFFASIFTGYTGWWRDSQEIDLKMIDIALAILAGEKGDKQNQQPIEARRFAISTLRARSGVVMSDKDWESWINSRVPLVYVLPPPYEAPKVLGNKTSFIAAEREAVEAQLFGIWTTNTPDKCEVKLSPAVFMELHHAQFSGSCTDAKLLGSKSFDVLVSKEFSNSTDNRSISFYDGIGRQTGLMMFSKNAQVLTYSYEGIDLTFQKN